MSDLNEELMDLNQYLSEEKGAKRKAMVKGQPQYTVNLLLQKGKSYAGLVGIDFQWVSS